MKYANTFLSAYDRIESRWHTLQKSKLISNIVILFFVAGVIASLLSYFKIIDIKLGKFFAIELAFSVLLFVEVFDLFFIITHSVADSVGKQFEIISLILLRSSFKELGHLNLDLSMDLKSLQSLLPVLVDAFGAVVIFFITVLFYRKQRHIQITKSDVEKAHFVLQKKVVAAFMLFFFTCQIMYSIFLFFANKTINENLFNKLYTALVFSDILILILSLRYSNLYVHLFRYSSFALATVILRLSLSAPQYLNVVLSVSAGLFVLLVANLYNFLNKPIDNLVDCGNKKISFN
jgi:hypothetical protein